MASAGDLFPEANEDEGFIDCYVFPDTDLPPIATMLEAVGNGPGNSRCGKFARALCPDLATGSAISNPGTAEARRRSGTRRLTASGD